jgi:hypothetical protein
MINYDNFAVIILTHGRAEKVYTYNTLRKHGYTGNVYLMVDNEDEQYQEYKNIYKDKVIVFDKQKAIDITDSADNFKKRNSVVYARNYVYVKAKEIGLKYILVLDDDYSGFYNCFDNDRNYITKNIKIKNLDGYINAMLKFLINSNSDCIAFSQGGDFIGGEGSNVSRLHIKGKLSRKAMNAFFFDVDKPLFFSGRINEDVSMYISEGKIGKKIFTYARVRLEQMETQANSGGLTEIYKDLGTYVKSFYSIIYNPSCVKLMMMGSKHKRIHHKILWKYATPMILSENCKK